MNDTSQTAESIKQENLKKPKKPIWMRGPWLVQRLVFAILCLGGISLLFRIERPSNFSAALQTKFIHFTNDEKALLLNSITNVDILSVTGAHSIPLPGKFTIRNADQLNQEQRSRLRAIENLDFLTVELNTEQSSLTLVATEPNEALEIEEIRFEQADVNNRLAYNFCPPVENMVENTAESTLVDAVDPSIATRPATKTPPCRHFFQLLTVGDKQQTGNFLSMDLDAGQNTAYVLQINDLDIPELGLSDIGRLELEYRPALDIPPLLIDSTADIAFNVSGAEPFDPASWFFRELSVSNVSFQELTSSAIDKPTIDSGLLGGEITFVGQELEIDEEAFVSFNKTTVRKLLAFTITGDDQTVAVNNGGLAIADTLPSISIRASGRAKQIAISPTPPEFDSERHDVDTAEFLPLSAPVTLVRSNLSFWIFGQDVPSTILAFAVVFAEGLTSAWMEKRKENE